MQYKLNRNEPIDIIDGKGNLMLALSVQTGERMVIEMSPDDMMGCAMTMYTVASLFKRKQASVKEW